MNQTNIKSRKTIHPLCGYDLLVVSVIVFTLLLTIAVWIWYGYKDAQIESQILQIK